MKNMYSICIIFVLFAIALTVVITTCDDDPVPGVNPTPTPLDTTPTPGATPNATPTPDVTPTPTVDENPPALEKSLCNPANESTDVDITISKIELTFDEIVIGTTGSYSISPSDNFESIAYNSIESSDETVVLDVSNLQCTTTYTITVQSIEDANGNAMGTDSISFSTDSAAPSILKSSCNPADGSTVDNFTTAMLMFDEDIDIASGNVSLSPGGTAVIDTDLSEGEKLYVQLLNLDCSGETYTLTVSGIRDNCGNLMSDDGITFTINPDGSPPEINKPACVPPDGATEVLTTISLYEQNKIKIQFNENIDAISASSASYSISPTTSGETINYNMAVGGTITLDVDNIQCNETYTVTVNGVDDECGQTMSEDSISFSTDSMPPELIGSDPEDDSTSVLNTITEIVLTFNEPVSDSPGSVSISPNTNGETVSILSAVGENLYLDVSLPCNAEDTYTITIDGIEDMCGNAMTDSDEITLGIIPDAEAPYITIHEPGINQIMVNPADPIGYGIEVIGCMFNEDVEGSVGTFSISPDTNGETIGYMTMLGSTTVGISVSNLQCSTTYTVTIEDITNSCGLAMESYNFSFTTINSNPSIIKEDCIPENGATGVSSSISQVTITFDSDVDGSAGTYNITQHTTSETLTYNSGASSGNIVALDVSGLDCSVARTYTLTIQNVDSVCGSYSLASDTISFTTTPDSNAPSAVISSPTNGAINVDPSDPTGFGIEVVAVMFDEIVYGSTGTYSISPNGNSESVAYNSVYTSMIGDPTIIVIDALNLQSATTYTITVQNVEDGCTNTMDPNPYTFTFTTQ